MKKHLPNIVTLLNLFFGCCAIVAILFQQLEWVFWFILAAAIADFLDGALARLLNAQSPVGKELDSLADMVSFGVVPGILFYVLLTHAWEVPLGAFCFGALPAFLITLFSALRLGRFNLDTRQTNGFLGLPTPSSTILAAGLYFMYHADSFGARDLLSNPWILFLLVLMISYLLVSGLPMFSLKFQHLRWKDNEIRYIFIATVPLFFLLSWHAAPALIIGTYILIALIRHLFKFQ